MVGAALEAGNPARECSGREPVGAAAAACDWDDDGGFGGDGGFGDDGGWEGGGTPTLAMLLSTLDPKSCAARHYTDSCCDGQTCGWG